MWLILFKAQYIVVSGYKFRIGNAKKGKDGGSGIFAPPTIGQRFPS